MISRIVRVLFILSALAIASLMIYNSAETHSLIPEEFSLVQKLSTLTAKKSIEPVPQPLEVDTTMIDSVEVEQIEPIGCDSLVINPENK